MEYYPPQLLIIKLIHMKTITAMNMRGWRVGGAYNGSHHDIHVDHQAGDGRALTGRSVPGSLGKS